MRFIPLRKFNTLKKIALYLTGIIALAGLVAACSGGSDLRDIAESKSVPSSQTGPVVVFLPGTLASVLVDTSTGERVWGRDDALSADPRTAEGLRQLSLPLDAVPSSVSAAPDLVRADDVLRRANERVVGIPFSIAIYDDFLVGMTESGLTETPPFAIPTRGPSVTPFPYDWRRSIVDAAQSLGAALEARGDDAQKVRIVAHSMGGAVALWYLMYGTAPLDSAGAPPPVTWAGAQYVDHAVFVGAPFRGAAIAVRNTINGNTIAGPLIPTFPPAMLASHPSSFELMPRGSVLSGTSAPLLDAATWERFQWGMADPEERENIQRLGRGASDPAALAIARQNALIARGKAFHAAADRPVDPPEGLRLTVIAGRGSATAAGINVSEETGNIEVGATSDGDGTVTLASAIAGFENSGSDPQKTVFTYDVEHMLMLSEIPVFEKVLDVLFE